MKQTYKFSFIRAEGNHDKVRGRLRNPQSGITKKPNVPGGLRDKSGQQT